MKDLRTLFIRWYFNEFVDLDPLHVEMATVFEDSPWHRERNVAVHTNMVVAEYLALPVLNFKAWTESDLFGAFACAFHDVGKPAARTEAYKPERGTYYRYGGHELISARLWEDWAVRNWKFLKEEFGLPTHVIHRVSWLIEYHLPWGIKKYDKREQLAVGLKSIVRNPETFINILKADTWGRISDDGPEKKETVNAWCEEFLKLYSDVNADYYDKIVNIDAPVLYIPIGASGSGKSTLFKSDSMKCVMDVDRVEDVQQFSMDILRMAWYDKDDYSNAFNLACADKDFMNKVARMFVETLKMGKSIYLDNINISKKRRMHHIREARRFGYRVSAILMPVDIQTVTDRQASRADKEGPLYAIQEQYMQLQMPSLGEVDDIIIYSGNLP